MSAVFASLVSANLAGCDLSQEIIDVVTTILTGNGNGGCLAGCVTCAQDCGCVDCNCACDCADCACDCDSCAGCDGCVIQKIPGGFAGAHPGARISNAAQVRVTDGAFTFAENAIPTLLGAIPNAPLPYFPLDLDSNGTPEVAVRVELRNPDISTPAVSACDGNWANGLGQDHACIRARFDVNYRSCTYSANPATQAANCNNGADSFTFTTNVPVAGDISCTITVNSEGVVADQHDNLPIEAKLAVINETTGPYAGYSRIALLDAEIVTNAAFEDEDVSVDCNVSDNLIATAECPGAVPLVVFGCGGFNLVNCCRSVCGDSSCTLDELVADTINDLAPEDADTVADDLDDLIDDILDDLLQDYSKDSYSSGTTLLDNGQVCMLASSQASCPTGTTYVATRKTCTINSAPTSSGDGPAAERKRCVSPLLGLEARLNMGAILSSISPGLNAVVDFVFAAGGDGVSAGGGYNINFMGGLENLSHDNCVPLLQAGDPGYVANPGTSIPQAAAFQQSVRPGTTNPYDVGIAVSAEFVNYALFKLWDSGMLCLNVTSGLSSQLAPTTFSPLLFSGSINRFLFPLAPGASYLGLSIRPGQPPIAIAENIPNPDDETDQVLSVEITLPDLGLDFYFWTNDRFTRIATLKSNLTVGLTINLEPGPAGESIKLKIGKIDFADAALVNGNSMLSASDLANNVGASLNRTAPLIAGGLAGALPNIALEELINGVLAGGVGGLQLPVHIDFTPDSILSFEEAGGHSYVGVFLNLETTAGNPLTQRAQTSVEITSVTMPEDRSAFALETLGEGALPRVEIAMSADGPEGAEYEYSYRTTFSEWSEWSRSRYAVIEHPSLVLQQRQQVFARSRIVGTELGTDISSAKAEFVIDVTEPAIQVTTTPDGNGELQAFDFVYGTDLEYRVDGGDWKRITTGVVELGGVTNSSVIEVRDGSGNVAANNKIRGRTDPDAAVGGCGCVAAGMPTSSNSGTALGLSLALLGLVALRRRKR